MLSHGTNDPAKSLTFAPPALARIAGARRTTYNDRHKLVYRCWEGVGGGLVNEGITIMNGTIERERRTGLIGSRVNSVQLWYSVCDLYQARVSALCIIMPSAVGPVGSLSSTTRSPSSILSIVYHGG